MKKVIGLLLVMFLMISFAGQSVFACPELANDREKISVGSRQQEGLKTILYGVEHARISKAAEEYVTTSIDEIMETLVVDPEFYDASDRKLDELFLLAPFQIYTLDGESLDFVDNLYHFPVYSNRRIVCLVSVFYSDEAWHYQVSNMLVKELNSVLNDNRNRKVIQVESEDSLTPFSFMYDEGDAIHEGSDNVFLDLSGQYQEPGRSRNLPEEHEQTRDDQLVNYLSSFITTNVPTQGFSINQTYYKRLDMSYCLVDQGSYNCGLACICTLYRYRTATHTLTPAIGTDINNVLAGGAYSFGTTVGQVGFINYLMPVAAANQYEIHHDYEGLITHLEVQHNINNKFPIIYGGYRIVNGVTKWHAFVLQGYQISNNKMKFYYFSPHGYDVSTDYVSAGTPHMMIYGTYSYTEGGNAYLLKP